MSWFSKILLLPQNSGFSKIQISFYVTSFTTSVIVLKFFAYKTFASWPADFGLLITKFLLNSLSKFSVWTIWLAAEMSTEVESAAGVPKTLPNGPIEGIQYPLKVQYCGGLLPLFKINLTI